jgi:diguanylate cyclase (GGDEF)-like protein
MAILIETKRDVLRHTVHRVVTAACLAVGLLAAMLLIRFGTDLKAEVSVAQVMSFDLFAGFFISTIVCAALTYRSGLLMMALTHTRRELARISQTDQLTGLFNRWGFNEAAEAALAEARRSGAPVAILMCDLDHFKSINDRFGHEVGDHVLAETADVLRQFARTKGALVGRYGGEEFALVMVGTGREHARQHAEDIRQACAARTVLDGKTPLPVTISIGLTVAQGDLELAELMREADHALYAAKRGGRDRVVEARAAA